MKFDSLPDIAFEKPNSTTGTTTTFSGIQWVGMEKIQMPIRFNGQVLAAEIQAQVNLQQGTSRGIHMSRLYSLLSNALSVEDISWSQLENLAQNFIQSQEGISQAARLAISFQLPVQRESLKSEMKGWRLYPVTLSISQDISKDILNGNTSENRPENKKEKVKHEELTKRKIKVEVLYSSTCPASMALSRELWRQEFQAQFQQRPDFSLQMLDQWMAAQKGMPASPHAQRSRAEVEIELSRQAGDFGPLQLISGLEQALQTPVQTFVKRTDEQEFARLNGENPLFCEDAARRVQAWLDLLSPKICAYWGQFEHHESLHPHNAVAVIEKL